jgi:Uncharacterized conserved protein
MATSLPQSFYRAEQVREGEQAVARALSIPLYQLMLRAGQSVFDCINQHYPNAARLLIVCGAGNNAGDGYVIARLAKSAGLNITVWSLVTPNKLEGDAATAWQEWQDCGGSYVEHHPPSASLMSWSMLSWALDYRVPWRERLRRRSAPSTSRMYLWWR